MRRGERAEDGRERGRGTADTARRRGSVYEARHAIFDASLSRDKSPFKALSKLQAAGGFIGPKIASYYPKPHFLMRHPVYRFARNEQRMYRLDVLKKLGKAPPKKGQGKRAGKKK